MCGLGHCSYFPEVVDCTSWPSEKDSQIDHVPKSVPEDGPWTVDRHWHHHLLWGDAMVWSQIGPLANSGNLFICQTFLFQERHLVGEWTCDNFGIVHEPNRRFNLQKSKFTFFILKSSNWKEKYRKLPILFDPQALLILHYLKFL